MVVLARPADPLAGLASAEPRAPWQTRFARVPVAPPAGRPVAPIAIPVVGGRPIEAPRLTRAPWAEPLAAFAGVVVETRRVPDGWLATPPRPRPLVAIPVVADDARSLPPRRLTPIPPLDGAQPTRLVAIPVVVPVTAGAAAAGGDAPLPGRIVPFRAPLAIAVDPAPAAIVVSVTPTTVAPSVAAPRATSTSPRPRRGFIARSTSLAITVLATLTLLIRR